MTIHTDIPSELAKRIEALAAESALSADQILDRALRNGLDTWERNYRQIKKAAEEADRGEFASDEEVDRVFNKYQPEV